MTAYCFDTDVVSALVLPDPPLSLLRRVAAIRPTQQFTTAITAAELRFGAAKRGSADLARRVDDILADGHVLPFDADAALVFGPMRADLERTGRPAPFADLLIAAIALSRDLVMVTGNVRHLEPIPGLTVENWLNP